MFVMKRTWMMVAVLVMAMSGLSALSVSAQEGSAWLGVSVMDSDDGVVIGEVVSDSPAGEAGLSEGDVITALDDTEIDTVETLIDTIASHQPGDEVTLTVTSDGEAREVAVTLAERPADMPQRPDAQAEPPFRGILNIMGLNAEWTDEGLVVTSIDADSPLVDSGLQEGDVITAINGEELSGDTQPREWMRLFRLGDDPLVFTVQRGDETLDIEVTPDWDNLDIQIMPVEPGMMVRGLQLGVRFQVITPELVEEKDLTVSEGALVEEVYDDTPAAEAGLLAGDVITAVNSEPVDQERTLADRLAAYEEGDVVTLAVLRGDETLELEVTLAAGREMMDGFQMDPEHGRFFGQMMPNFFDIHPFMDGSQGGFHFRFGQPDSAPDTDTQEAPAEVVPSNPA